MNFNVVLPMTSSILSLFLFVLLLDQWRQRRRPYQLIWAIGMLWYGLSAGTEFLGGAFGWNETLYRLWYLIGAIWVAGWLGLGTIVLLARTRFGLALVPVFLLLALIALGGANLYPNTGVASPAYALVGLGLAIGVGWLSFRRDPRWAAVVAAWIVGGTVLSVVLMATASLAAPGWLVDPQTHIPVGTLFPGYLRLLTPLFNVTGAFALAFGALFSAYVFMPKRRVIRYDISSGSATRRLANLPLAVIAFPVNLVASLPGAANALLRGRLNSRVPATILIAIGAIIPAITSGLNRFGSTSGFFVGELLGVVFLLAGFLVSVEVFRDIRIPFTGTVLRTRRADATVDM
ncbi:MAG TPA: LPXTG cell wall anchor domain-containing protein [Candidatus Limnocylindrales bacterium]|nr:LPXTG cell wall anchor domain-containing protein [Candidatus Limnocylindrales bacterium]